MTDAAERRLYAKLTLEFAEHPKVVGLSDAAFRELIHLILYCARNTTDGIIPKGLFRKVDDDVISELTTNHPTRPSLVKMPDGNYRLHDFEKHQTSSEAIEAKRALRHEQAQRAGAASAEARRRKYGTASPTVIAEQVLEHPLEQVVEQAPNQEDRSQKTEVTTTPPPSAVPPKGAATRGSRLAETFTPRADYVATIRQEFPGLDIEAATTEFVNYWLAEAGARARKVDWNRAWLNRMREVGIRSRRGPTARVPSQDAKMVQRAHTLEVLGDSW